MVKFDFFCIVFISWIISFGTVRELEGRRLMGRNPEQNNSAAGLDSDIFVTCVYNDECTQAGYEKCVSGSCTKIMVNADSITGQNFPTMTTTTTTTSHELSDGDVADLLDYYTKFPDELNFVNQDQWATYNNNGDYVHDEENEIPDDLKVVNQDQWATYNNNGDDGHDESIEIPEELRFKRSYVNDEEINIPKKPKLKRGNVYGEEIKIPEISEFENENVAETSVATTDTTSKQVDVDPVDEYQNVPFKAAPMSNNVGKFVWVDDNGFQILD